MRTLELKVPPALLVIAFGMAMWLASVVTPAFRFSLPSRHMLALTLVAGGAGVVIAGIVSFARASTTVNPLDPAAASALVESGVYRFTRNPMYLGFVLVLLGWAVFLANIVAFPVLAGFVMYMNRFQIIPEERALAARFGSAFSSYARKVRRWL